MAQYIQRPSRIEAWQYDGTRASIQPAIDAGCKLWLTSELEWDDENGTFISPEGTLLLTPSMGRPTNAIIVHTLDGSMLVNVGDYLVQGADGEFYPAKRSIFEATYDPAGKAP